MFKTNTFNVINIEIFDKILKLFIEIIAENVITYRSSKNDTDIAMIKTESNIDLSKISKTELKVFMKANKLKPPSDMNERKLSLPYIFKMMYDNHVIGDVACNINSDSPSGKVLISSSFIFGTNEFQTKIRRLKEFKHMDDVLNLLNEVPKF